MELGPIIGGIFKREKSVTHYPHPPPPTPTPVNGAALWVCRGRESSENYQHFFFFYPGVLRAVVGTFQ